MTDSIDSRQLRVVRGCATPEELAALVAVLFARTAAGPDLPVAGDVVSVPAARWRRSERVHLFDAPRVWHAYARAAG
ncbi:acyl-CoA carboxylase epsilon subunit [Streptomyces sp. NPDC008139]|uniref:acyl-CoA carboxylase subunit epsilon n=1 Tax=Streptomyces sp. NPDC008139 TaxID=3364814 RepID=UPI0036E36DAD